MERYLYVTLFDALDQRNFAAGCRFERRTLDAVEAKRLIDDARSRGRLFGVTADDLHIRERERKSAQRLLQALAELEPPIALQLKDFIRSKAFVPLQMAAVRPDADLLMISCTYKHNGALRIESDDEDSDSFVIALGSLSFELFAALP